VTLQSITIRRPDDWHVHLRDAEMLDRVAPYTARQFARAVVMPNLVPPVTSIEAASGYRDRIRAAAGGDFTPLMTAYLTDQADPLDELSYGPLPPLAARPARFLQHLGVYAYRRDVLLRLAATPPHLRNTLAANSIHSFTAETAQSMYDFRAEDVVARIAPSFARIAARSNGLSTLRRR